MFKQTYCNKKNFFIIWNEQYSNDNIASLGIVLMLKIQK